MKKYMIAALVIVLMVVSSCSGCSESGRRAQQRRIVRENLNVPSYYVVSKIYKDKEIFTNNIVRYIANASIDPLPTQSQHDIIIFYDTANAFIIGDTIRLKK